MMKSKQQYRGPGWGDGVIWQRERLQHIQALLGKGQEGMWHGGQVFGDRREGGRGKH